MSRSDPFAALLTGFEPGGERNDWQVPQEILPHLSASSVTMFQRCPEQWRQRYVLGMKVRPLWTMTLGSANHVTHERTYNEKLAGREVTAAEAAEFFCDSALPDMIEQEGGLDEIDWRGDASEGREKALDLGSRMVSSYTEIVVPRIMPELPAETKWEISVPGVPVPLVGYIDLLVDGGPVLDIKTVGSATRTIQTGWQLQARLYSYVTARDVEYHTVSRAKEPRVFTALEAEGLLLRRSDRLSAMTFHQVAAVAQQINFLWQTLGPDQVWPANFASDACGWCGYRAFCAYWERDGD